MGVLGFAVRDNQDITGISVCNGEELKISMLADDTTCFIDGSN